MIKTVLQFSREKIKLSQSDGKLFQIFRKYQLVVLSVSSAYRGVHSSIWSTLAHPQASAKFSFFATAIRFKFQEEEEE